MTARRVGNRAAYTVIELMVVIGVVGVLIGLLLPAVQKVRESAGRTGCLSHLSQIGLAAHQFESVRGMLPPAYERVRSTGRGRALLSWFDQLLPYIEQETLWRLTLAAKRAEPFGFANPPHVGVTTAVRLYTCPFDGRLSAALTDDAGFTAAYSSYLGVTGGRLVLGPPLPTDQEGAMEHLGTGLRMTAITDGTSQTLFVGERTPPGRLFAGSWYFTGPPDPAWGELTATSICNVTRIEGDIGPCRGPFRFGPGRVENSCDAFHFWSLHPGGANFLFADGSARFLSYSAEPIMVALGTRAGGESVQPPD